MNINKFDTLIEIYYTKNSDLIDNEYYLPMIPRNNNNTNKTELQYFNLPIYDTKCKNIVGTNTFLRTINIDNDKNKNLSALATLNTPNGNLVYNLAATLLNESVIILPENNSYTFIPTYKSNIYEMYNDIKITLEILEDIRVLTIISKNK